MRVSTHLRENRAMVSKMVITELARAHPQFSAETGLLTRTLIGALSQTIEAADPDVVVQWAIMARAAQPTALISAAVSVACATVANAGSVGVAVEPAVLVLLELTKARVAEVLHAPEDRSQSVERGVIDSMLGMLRMRDEATCEHSQATGVWSRRLALALGLSYATTEFVERAGVLHDIGKIGTPDAILFKQGSLTSEEWVLMRQHAAFGADILSEIPTLARYAPVVRAHHERIDGTGYPYGLRGNEIVFEARVVAVADAFHAMISDRPYRPAMSTGQAMSVLRAGRNTHWDAAIVDAMVVIVANARTQAAGIDTSTLR
jgi:putative nucleotidyltransferase with HDIG domain